MRAAAFVTLAVVLAASAACTPASTGGSQPASTVGSRNISASSCAGVIELDGVQYIGGRSSAVGVPQVGAPLSAHTVGCDDGWGVTGPEPVTVFAIEGIRVAEAVVISAPYFELMLAADLWEVDEADLPAPLRQYIHR